METADIGRRQRRLRVLWSAVWLFVLGAPASEIWQGHDHPAALAVMALVAFAGMYLALWWRTSDPDLPLPVRLRLLGGLSALAIVTSLSFHGSWPFLFFFVSAAVACAVRGKWAMFGVAGVTGVDALVMADAWRHPMLRQVLGVLIAGVVVLWIIRMEELIRELNAAREELARLAVADERVRFARDLHDLLGHTLSLIVVKCEAVRRLVEVDTEAAARESADIEMVSRQALAEVREAVTNYRERSLDTELEGARAALMAAGIEARINQTADRLPDTVENVLGWTVREGVTNVVRHSNGRHCAIELHQANGMAVLEIYDDGDASGVRDPARVTVGVVVGESVGGKSVGGDSADSAETAQASVPGEASRQAPGGGGGRTGTGLRGLAERLAVAQGRLEAGRRPDGGFCLAVTVPLDTHQQE